MSRVDIERAARKKLGMTDGEHYYDSHLHSCDPETGDEDDGDDAGRKKLYRRGCLDPTSTVRKCVEYETHWCRNRFKEILDHKDVAAMTTLFAEKPS